MVAFEGSWPQGCHEAIKKMVVTMNGSRKHVKVEELEIYNTETIFARVMVLLSVGEITLDEIFYPLSPIPTLFQKNGEK